MIINVKYDFLTSLNNNIFTIISSSYEDASFENEKFVNDLFVLETGAELSVPQFLAEKDLALYIQSLYPNAKITQTDERN